MSVIQDNISVETDIEMYPVPVKSDGKYYRYELIDTNSWVRIYSDDSLELIQYFIPDYNGEYTKLLNHAVSTQVKAQAQLLSYYLDVLVSDAELEILIGPRHIQPSVQRWTSQVPLILIDSFYHPHTQIAPPIGNFIERDDNLLWIKTTEGVEEYLKSLDYLGLIKFNILTSEVK
jgi:hypothetical protein